MEKKTEIGIGILPSEDYTLFVRDQEIYLAKKYDTVRGLLQPPHVTIKRPFFVNSIGPFDKYCAGLAKNIKSFKIQVDRYGFFEPRAIFLNVIPSNDLVNLHLKVLKELNQKFGIEKNNHEGPNQIFHTTIAYEDLSKKNFYKARKELESKEQPKCSFVFDSIGLFRFTGEEWAVYKKYNVRM